MSILHPGAVLKSRWPSWSPVPNKPMVSVDVKQQSTNDTSLASEGIYLFADFLEAQPCLWDPK